MGNNSSLGCRLVSTLRSRERNRSSEALQWSLINTFTWSRAYYWPHLLASWSTSSSPSLEFISRANSVEKTKQSESCRHFWDLSKLEIVIERLERERERAAFEKERYVYICKKGLALQEAEWEGGGREGERAFSLAKAVEHVAVA